MMSQGRERPFRPAHTHPDSLMNHTGGSCGSPPPRRRCHKLRCHKLRRHGMRRQNAAGTPFKLLAWPSGAVRTLITSLLILVMVGCDPADAPSKSSVRQTAERSGAYPDLSAYAYRYPDAPPVLDAAGLRDF
ncbi:MAG: hypothetical protein ACE5E1_10855, partial [Phycisphaerae bacterium]